MLDPLSVLPLRAKAWMPAVVVLLATAALPLSDNVGAGAPVGTVMATLIASGVAVKEDVEVASTSILPVAVTVALSVPARVVAVCVLLATEPVTLPAADRP